MAEKDFRAANAVVYTIGVITDSNNAVTMDAKADGDLVYVLGATKNEFGGEYYDSQRVYWSKRSELILEKQLRAIRR